MKTETVATGLWLTISRRLNSPEFVQTTGFGVESIEKRVHLLPGGLLSELHHYRDHGDRFADTGFRFCLRLFICMAFTDATSRQATGNPKDYWLGLLG